MQQNSTGPRNGEAAGIQGTTWRNFGDVPDEEGSHAPSAHSRTGKPETESRLVFLGGLRSGGWREAGHSAVFVS